MQSEIPTINITNEETDPGWRRVETGEVVKTYYQCYYFAPEVGWRLSSFWTVEEYRNRGVSNYREPASVKAWLIILPQLVKKVWARVKQGGKLP